MPGPFAHPSPPDPTPRRRRLALPAATLVVVGLLAGALAIGAALPPRGPARLPAPAAGLGLVADEVLLRGRVDPVPPGAEWLSLLRVTLEPGAAWELGRERYGDDGALLFRVGFGAPTLRAERPVGFTPAGAPDARALPPRTDADLRPGDQGFIPAGVPARWRNDGRGPAEVLLVKLSLVGFGGACAPPPPGVAVAPLVEQREFGQPADPVVATVRRVTLAPRGVLPVDAVPGLELLYVASGALAAHDPPQAGDLVNPLMPALEGTGHPIEQATAARGAFRPGRVLRAGAEEPAVLLLLTVAPAEPAAAPASPPSARGQALAPVRLSSGGQGLGGGEPRSPLREGVSACV
jgi:quercetin dioxygenase-like cupin family protein